MMGGNHFARKGRDVLTNFRRERSIRRTLRLLARQRVVGIMAGNVWCIELAMPDDDETHANLRTADLRGWAEPLQDNAVRDFRWTGSNVTAAGTTVVYRLTDGGWAAIQRAHMFNVVMLFLTFVAAVAAVAALKWPA